MGVLFVCDETPCWGLGAGCAGVLSRWMPLDFRSEKCRPPYRQNRQMRCSKSPAPAAILCPAFSISTRGRQSEPPSVPCAATRLPRVAFDGGGGTGVHISRGSFMPGARWTLGFRARPSMDRLCFFGACLRLLRNSASPKTFRPWSAGKRRQGTGEPRPRPPLRAGSDRP